MTESTLVWSGADAPRLELVRVRVHDRDLHAVGTQIGVEPEPYELPPGRLRVETGGRTVDVPLDGADFFDLETSPLFNSLPVLRHDLHRGGESRDFTMRWVAVPSLEVERSEQRYEPLGRGRVRFLSGEFSAEIDFDDRGFVVRYPGLAERIWSRRR